MIRYCKENLIRYAFLMFNLFFLVYQTDIDHNIFKQRMDIDGVAIDENAQRERELEFTLPLLNTRNAGRARNRT